MPNTKSIYFGLSPVDPISDGIRPACAINAENAPTVVEIHQDTGHLYWRLGVVRGVRLIWQRTPSEFDTGYDPSVALTPDGLVVEVHGSREGDDGHLYHAVTRLGGELRFPAAERIGGDGDHAYDPSVTIAGLDTPIVVYNSGSTLHFRTGVLIDGKLTWGAARPLPKPDDSGDAVVGSLPSVAGNACGAVVVCYEHSGNLFVMLGKLDDANTGITWQAPERYESGSRPSVTLTGDNHLFEVHEAHTSGNIDAAGLSAGFAVDTAGIFQRVGKLRINDDDVMELEWRDWLGIGAESYFCDAGNSPCVAANDKVAVAVHVSETRDALFGNASLIFDRANWMGDHLDKIGSRTLRNLALPASHDTGAYSGATANRIAQTQDLDVAGQLNCGVRYFDIRPLYEGDKDADSIDESKLYTHHDIVRGPKLTEVIAQVKAFMAEHRELVILKLSDYQGFNQKVFDGLARLFKRELGQWLFKGPGRRLRLAEKLISQYIGRKNGSVLVVADADKNDLGHDGNPTSYVDNPYPNPDGIWRYRDWYAHDPEHGDLTVFDFYSNTNKFEVMADGNADDPDDEHAKYMMNGEERILPRGQLPKFGRFNGLCRNSTVPCDLFLLSWTLTPMPGSEAAEPAIRLSRAANKALADRIYGAVPPPRRANQRPITINLIYTDAVEKARSVDVALRRNGLPE